MREGATCGSCSRIVLANSYRAFGRVETTTPISAIRRSPTSKLALLSGPLFCIVMVYVLTLGVVQVRAGSSPVIACVSEVLPQQTQTITIAGGGFGTHDPYTGDSDYIRVSDVTRGWNAGSTRDDPPDYVTLVVNSWTNRQIVLGGFSGDYGQNDWTLETGDQVSFQVWNAQTGEGPAEYDAVVGSLSACPSGETTSWSSWGGYERTTEGLWNATLLPDDMDFSGRTVREQNGNPGGGGSGKDTCWFEGSAVPKADKITGGTWTVGSGTHAQNEYGPDAIGWSKGAVDYYREKGRAPCGTTLYQRMEINDPNTGKFFPYGGKNTGNVNTLGAHIGMTTVSSTRAGQTKTKTFH